MRTSGLLLGALLISGAISNTAAAQVLGACGSKDALKPAPRPAGAAAGGMTRVPMPGEAAPNFELAAVVGQQIRPVRLSDYDGKWRVVCFYPADFTFV